MPEDDGPSVSKSKSIVDKVMYDFSKLSFVIHAVEYVFAD